MAKDRVFMGLHCTEDMDTIKFRHRGQMLYNMEILSIAI